MATTSTSQMITVATEKAVHDTRKEQTTETGEPYIKVLWPHVFFFVFLHLSAVYGLYLGLTTPVSRATIIFELTYGILGGLGVTAGAHRLWAHRSYKAKWPLRVFLCICNSIAGEDSIYLWARNHRVHHKFSETDADPYSIKRGFFFAHIGWLMCTKHPDVIRKGKLLSFQDLLDDPIVRFQHRFSYLLYGLLCICVPTIIPPLFWGESYCNAFFGNLTRYCILLNSTFLVNSAAHTYGNRPYDKWIEARQSPVVSLFALGEGWHNYHHAFPSDYATSELGYTINFTKMFIDAMALLGLAYDLKTTPKDLILHKKMKSGDGSTAYLK